MALVVIGSPASVSTFTAASSWLSLPSGLACFSARGALGAASAFLAGAFFAEAFLVVLLLRHRQVPFREGFNRKGLDHHGRGPGRFSSPRSPEAPRPAVGAGEFDLLDWLVEPDAGPALVDHQQRAGDAEVRLEEPRAGGELEERASHGRVIRGSRKPGHIAVAT